MNTPVFLAGARAALVVTAVAMTSACSLIQPHLEGDAEKRAAAISLQAKPADDQKFYGNIEQAIGYADSLRQNYERGYRDHTLARNVAALAVIPVSATALYLGFVNNAGKETTAPLGFAAAGVLGVTGYFTSKQVQHIYVNAAQRIGCSIIGSRPYLLTMGEYKAFQAHMLTINRNLPLQAASESDEIKKYRTIYAGGLSFLAKVDVAPSSLVMAADAVRLEVDRKLIDNTGNLDQLPKTISGIGQTGQDITKLPKATPAAATNNLSAAHVAMRADIEKANPGDREGGERKAIDLQNAAAAVSEFVNERAALASAISQLPICAVAGTVPMRLSPSDSPISVKQGGTSQVKVVGGTGVPKASFVGATPDSKNLTMDVKIVGGEVLIVLGAPAAADTSTKATVSVSDAPGEYKKTFDVEVVAK